MDSEAKKSQLFANGLAAVAGAVIGIAIAFSHPTPIMGWAGFLAALILFIKFPAVLSPVQIISAFVTGLASYDLSQGQAPIFALMLTVALALGQFVNLNAHDIKAMALVRLVLLFGALIAVGKLTIYVFAVLGFTSPANSDPIFMAIILCSTNAFKPDLVTASERKAQRKLERKLKRRAEYEKRGESIQQQASR